LTALPELPALAVLPFSLIPVHVDSVLPLAVRDALLPDFELNPTVVPAK
jgi:hypothetical protein